MQNIKQTHLLKPYSSHGFFNRRCKKVKTGDLISSSHLFYSGPVERLIYLHTRAMLNVEPFIS